MLTRGRPTISRTLRAAVGTTIMLTRGRPTISRTLRAAVGTTIMLTRGRPTISRTLRAAVGTTIMLTRGRPTISRTLGAVGPAGGRHVVVVECHGCSSAVPRPNAGVRPTAGVPHLQPSPPHGSRRRTATLAFAGQRTRVRRTLPPGRAGGWVGRWVGLLSCRSTPERRAPTGHRRRAAGAPPGRGVVVAGWPGRAGAPVANRGAFRRREQRRPDSAPFSPAASPSSHLRPLRPCHPGRRRRVRPRDAPEFACS